MNIRVLYTLVLSIAVLFGCKKLSDLTKFDIDYSTNMSIPASPGLGIPLDILSPGIETNFESKFQANDTRKDLIEHLKLKKLELTHLTPADGNFDFLESVDVYISADGLDEIMIANTSNVSATAKVISLQTKDIDLIQYILKDDFKIRLRVVTDKTTTEDQQIKVYTVFNVDARILGQ